MIIFPAIDIINGKVVRLTHGDYDQQVTYEMTPLEAAQEFKACGAEYIHVVDLDGAKEGKPVNFELICEIIRKTGMFVQVGGGIRSHDSIKMYIDAGVGRVILGTIAINNLPFLRDMVGNYGKKISVGIDAKDGFIAVRGWREMTLVKAEEHCMRIGSVGVKTVVYTDISKDGALEGTNLELYQRLVNESSVQLIASGGITSIDEIIALRDMGMYGAIVGKALYNGNLNLKEVLAVARGEE
jgi:phosphoribosylformimino-5-aminoimidazole carboxamide ribotide isomerase